MEFETRRSQPLPFAPENLFNVIVKSIGLYWFTGGMMNVCDVIYALYLERFTAYAAATDQQTASWGIAMVAIGAWMIAYSRWIAKVSFAFDSTPENTTQDTDVGS